MCIQAEFEIMNILLKGWRSKYKPANALILAEQIFRAASERTLTKKTYMFNLLIKLLPLIHLCHLHLDYMLWNYHC